MSEEYKYYIYGAQSILKALKREIDDRSKEEILEIIDELIESFEMDLEKNEDE
jgi:hypothetical protein